MRREEVCALVVGDPVHSENAGNEALEAGEEVASLRGVATTERRLPAELNFKELVPACTSFALTGVCLAWWVIAGLSLPSDAGFTLGLLAGWIDKSVARQQPPLARRRGATFPFRIGELAKFREVLRTADWGTVRCAAFVETWCQDAWLFLSLVALNDLAGSAPFPREGGWSSAELRAVGSIRKAVDLRCQRDATCLSMSELAWQKELRSKHVGYNGDEVTTCQELCWDQVAPALPPEEHGASIETLDWVCARTREYLLNPNKLLKDPGLVNLPRMPGKIHMKAEDKWKIASELVKRRICDWIPLDKVHCVNGVRILNGLFGVSKPAVLEDGRHVLRLIMNLTGSNSTQEQLTEGCSGLPSITAWQSVVLDGNQSLSLYQSDMCSAFYLFKLPAVWKPHLAFNILASGSELGGPIDKQWALCCNVIPMGWLNSVGIMQEISENLMKFGGMNINNMISRDKLLPQWMNCVLDEAKLNDRTWFHVYLDNFAAGERISPGDPAVRGRSCHEIAERAWSAAGVISSEKKRVSAASQIGELGAEVNGQTQTLGVSSEKLVAILQATLWLISQTYLNRKFVQILAGRWMFVLQFRRPGMVIFDLTWKFISATGKITNGLRQAVKQEFLCAICLSGFWQCSLGASILPKIVATDASESGGAVGYAECLNQQGRDFLETSKLCEQDNLESVVPVMVLSLFNGIGGAFRCYDILGLRPMVRVAVEKDAGANRVTSRRWPGTVMVLDVADVQRDMIKGWARQYLGIVEIHLWAGFPCTDLSKAKFGRLNLWGEQSSLFWHIPRIKKLLREEFGDLVIIRWVCENVASMDRQAAEEISEELECQPYLVDCVQAVPMRRPRYGWTSESLAHLFPDVWIEQKSYWMEVIARAEYPLVEQWITPGYEWNGEQQQSCFPTCMKSIPRDRPPPKPAGLSKCSPQTVARWREDSFRYPPYQYAWEHLLTTSTTWRLLNEDEKEVLLGYGRGHTPIAWSASKQKQNKQGFSDARHSYLGDSFSIVSFVIFAFACCKSWLPHLPYQHLVKRLGMAPGFRSPIRLCIPLGRNLKYGSDCKLWSPDNGMEQFNRMMLRRTNHTGSDIRVTTGEVFNARTFPRQSVEAEWWDWKPGFARKWGRKAHINVLELEAILMGLKFQIQRFHCTDARIFQVTDSYVCMSVVSKGRSSSRQLQRVIRVISAHLLAHGLFLIIAHVDSSTNPTDAMSRRV